jgi:hypothetical protein
MLSVSWNTEGNSWIKIIKQAHLVTKSKMHTHFTITDGNNWETEEMFVRAAVALETEQTNGDGTGQWPNPSRLWWWNFITNLDDLLPWQKDSSNFWYRLIKLGNLCVYLQLANKWESFDYCSFIILEWSTKCRGAWLCQLKFLWTNWRS